MMFFWYAVAGAALIIAVSLAQRSGNLYKELCVAVGLVIVTILCIPAASLSGRLRPFTLDWYFYLTDKKLGLNGLILARYVYSTPWLILLITVVYDSLPLAFAIVWVFGKPSAVLLRSMILAAIGAPMLYLLVPAVGPAHAFAGFPWADPHGHGWLAVDIHVPRNCFPSLHFVWALLLLMNSRERAVQSLATVFLALTALATVGGGEHYVVDLIVSVPFALAVQVISARYSEAEEMTTSGALPSPQELARVKPE